MTIKGSEACELKFERSTCAISADLPERTDPKTRTTKRENGVFTAVIKKRAESQPKQIEIQRREEKMVEDKG